MNLFFQKKKIPLIEHKSEIKEDIQTLFSNKSGIYIKVKEEEMCININILIDKRIIGIDDQKKKNQIPNILLFLLVLDPTYPDEAPKLVTKSNFYTPSLMDGRDLLNEVCPNWNPKTKLKEIISGIIPFCAKVINSRTYQFFGTFHLESVYNMKIFDKLIVNSFKCRISQEEKVLDKQLNVNSDYIIILSGDTFILFEIILPLIENKAKIVFWANILSITDLQINQQKKTASINFYEDIENQEYHLKLIIENIIIFRDTLVSRMNSLDIRVVSKMVDPMKQLKKRITLKDITTMNLEEIEQNVKELKKIIDKGEVDSYTVNTFTTLCGKAIEGLNKNNDEIKQFEFMNMMKSVLQMEQVSKLTEMERNKDKSGNININVSNVNNNINNKNEINNNKDKKDDNELLYENVEEKKEDKKVEEKKEDKKVEENKEDKKEDKNEIIIDN